MNEYVPQPIWPEHVWCGELPVEENVAIARDTYRLRVRCPELARQFLPGQFLMLRLAGYDDPLLGRPLALYDTVLDPNGEPDGIEVVYLVQGRLTSRLKTFQSGQRIGIWGPLGNGFAPRPTEHLVMVAGGIGQTPFLAVARQALGQRQYADRPAEPWAQHVTLCYGARSADLLAGVEDFQSLGIDVQIATDDGSAGHHGLVTDLLLDLLKEHAANVRVMSCGPEPMMAAVVRTCQQFDVPCEVSLECPMACGIGICFSCVAKLRTADGWDYRRTCLEGPVFDGCQVVFD